MKKTVKYIGLDVHKNSISIAVADQGRDSEVRYYKLISQGAELRCVYEAGCCGYHLHRFSAIPE